MRKMLHCLGALTVPILLGSTAQAAAVVYNNLTPNNQMAMATRPSAGGKTEIEAADDFSLSLQTLVQSGSFVGLLTGAQPVIGDVTVEIYRVFPLDSTTPPSTNVPTRNNSPSDNAFDSRMVSAGQLTFTISVLSANFTANNSVLNGINKSPGQTTGGEAAVRGTEVQIDFVLTTPFNLPADHYFFVPQVQVTGGEFYWLSASRPISGAGTTPQASDLQAWIRNEGLAPDWLRVGTDIVGGATPPQFNAAFALEGTEVPEPASMLLALTGLAAVALLRRNPKH